MVSKVNIWLENEMKKLRELAKRSIENNDFGSEADYYNYVGTPSDKKEERDNRDKHLSYLQRFIKDSYRQRKRKEVAERSNSVQMVNQESEVQEKPTETVKHVVLDLEKKAKELFKTPNIPKPQRFADVIANISKRNEDEPKIDIVKDDVVATAVSEQVVKELPEEEVVIKEDAKEEKLQLPNLDTGTPKETDENAITSQQDRLRSILESQMDSDQSSVL